MLPVVVSVDDNMIIITLVVYKIKAWLRTCPGWVACWRRRAWTACSQCPDPVRRATATTQQWML